MKLGVFLDHENNDGIWTIEPELKYSPYGSKPGGPIYYRRHIPIYTTLPVSQYDDLILLAVL